MRRLAVVGALVGVLSPSAAVGTLPHVTRQQREIREAVLRYGPSVDRIAARYTNPVTGKRLTGQALLAKVLQGESGAWRDPAAAARAVSSAGARRWAQFIPTTRAEVIRKFGVDPWRSIDEAVHATALHLRGKVTGRTGLEGYNPGDPSYPAYILGQHVGRVGPHRPAGVSMSGRPVAGAPSGATAGVSALPVVQGPGVQLPQAAPIVGSLPQPPAFTAGPTMPKGYQAPVSGGGPPAPEPVQLPTPTQQPGLPGATAASAGGGVGGGAARLGKVRITGPNPGRIQPKVVSFLEHVAGVYGKPLVGSDGSGHSKFTTTGNISEHWTGAAVDLPARGARLIAMGQAALIAAGWSERRARRVRGGLFNVEHNGHRYQIIFNVTGDANGGDHTNHLHVGVR